jgi:hypothetical protein
VAPSWRVDSFEGVFQLKYFNTNHGSGHIIVSNAGTLGSGSIVDDSASTICANFYSFDPNEEMQTCCSCPVTPNGLSSLNILEDIVAQNLIVNPSSAIPVKVLVTAKAWQGATCDPGKTTIGESRAREDWLGARTCGMRRSKAVRQPRSTG